MRIGGAVHGCVRQIILIAGGCALLAIGGCGVRGALEAPASAKAKGTAKSAESGDPGENSAAGKKQHEPFVLDGLIR